MGYDTSHHPIDVELITQRIVPYILGLGVIDDLVADAIRVSKVRHRANAWGLAAHRHFAQSDQPFDSDLYVWGRPFFVTVEGTPEIAEAIDRYLVEWGRDPQALRVDGIEPPSGETIALAARWAQKVADAGWVAPTRVVPDGDAGIAFELRSGDLFQSLAILADGQVLLSTYVGCKLESRQGLV